MNFRQAFVDSKIQDGNFCPVVPSCMMFDEYDEHEVNGWLQDKTTCANKSRQVALLLQRDRARHL